MTSYQRSRPKPSRGSDGRSTSSTSAPMSASIIPQNGPGPDRLELEHAKAGERSHDGDASEFLRGRAANNPPASFPRRRESSVSSPQDTGSPPSRGRRFRVAARRYIMQRRRKSSVSSPRRHWVPASAGTTIPSCCASVHNAVVSAERIRNGGGAAQRGVVVTYATVEPADRDSHEARTRAGIATKLAQLKGFAFAGEYDRGARYDGPRVFRAERHAGGPRRGARARHPRRGRSVRRRRAASLRRDQGDHASAGRRAIAPRPRAGRTSSRKRSPARCSRVLRVLARRCAARRRAAARTRPGARQAAIGHRRPRPARGRRRSATLDARARRDRRRRAVDLRRRRSSRTSTT